MKKLVIMVYAAMACMNVNAQNKLGINDVEYKMTMFEKTHFDNQVVYSVGSDGPEYTAGKIALDGSSLGINAGCQYFDGNFSPFIGISVGWDGGKKVPLGFEYMGTFSRATYTDEADRNNSYLGYDSKFIGKLRLYTSPNKVFQWYLGAYYSLKLNFDYHENETERLIVKETEDEVVTIHEKVGNDYDFGGATSGGGGMLELVIRPWWMSRHSIRVIAGGGMQQRYYSAGNRWHPEFFIGAKWTYNFSAAELWDNSFLQKTGLSKKQVKKLSKQSRTARAW